MCVVIVINTVATAGGHCIGKLELQIALLFCSLVLKGLKGNLHRLFSWKHNNGNTKTVAFSSSLPLA